MDTLHAYIDESRLRTGEGAQNLYLMGAAVISANQVLRIQQRLREVLPAGVKRLHWRDDRPGVRRKRLELLAELHAAAQVEGFEAHAVITQARREHAARERCLAALAAELGLRGVGELVIEARQEHENARDSRLLLRARADGVTPRTLQWRHGKPLGEPLLWVPDAIVGVVGHALVGRDPDRLIDLLPDGLRHQVWEGKA